MTFNLILDNKKRKLKKTGIKAAKNGQYLNCINLTKYQKHHITKGRTILFHISYPHSYSNRY